MSNVAIEAVGPRRNIRSLRNDRKLIFVVGNNFSKLILDVFRLNGLSSNVAECLSSLVDLALLDEVTWRFGEEEETGPEDDGPEELDGDWDTV